MKTDGRKMVFNTEGARVPSTADRRPVAGYEYKTIRISSDSTPKSGHDKAKNIGRFNIK
jgi:hypothetical protein